MGILIVSILLLVLIAVDFAALTTYRRLVRLLQDHTDLRQDWSLLADGHTGDPVFERLWLKTAQKHFERISEIDQKMA